MLKTRNSPDDDGCNQEQPREHTPEPHARAQVRIAEPDASDHVTELAHPVPDEQQNERRNRQRQERQRREKGRRLWRGSLRYCVEKSGSLGTPQGQRTAGQKQRRQPGDQPGTQQGQATPLEAEGRIAVVHAAQLVAHQVHPRPGRGNAQRKHLHEQPQESAAGIAQRRALEKEADAAPSRPRQAIAPYPEQRKLQQEQIDQQEKAVERPVGENGIPAPSGRRAPIESATSGSAPPARSGSR